jgi:hypothetical protein
MSGAVLRAVLLCCVGSALAAQGVTTALQPCTWQVTNPTSLTNARDLLKKDAFADAYDAYVKDLETLQTELDAWVKDSREYADGLCKSLTEGVTQYDKDVAAFDASYCVVGPVTPEQVPGCQSQKDQLDQRRGILLQRIAQSQAIEAGLRSRGADITARSAPALTHATTVLDPDHVEDALRLYISWLQRNSTGSSCYDFAKIAEQLGARVANQKMFLQFLARNMITSPGLLNGVLPKKFALSVAQFYAAPDLAPFRFGASGFKARFRTDNLNDNQVRHAIAYMVVGYSWTGTGADLVAQFRDERIGEPQDYWLGVEAGHMGFQLRTGTYDAGNFGRSIRGRLCD